MCGRKNGGGRRRGRKLEICGFTTFPILLLLKQFSKLFKNSLVIHSKRTSFIKRLLDVPLAKFSYDLQQVLSDNVVTADNDGFYTATHVPGRFKTGHLTGWKFSSWEIFRQLFCSTRRLLKSNYISSGKSETIRGL